MVSVQKEQDIPPIFTCSLSTAILPILAQIHPAQQQRVDSDDDGADTHNQRPPFGPQDDAPRLQNSRRGRDGDREQE